MNERMLELARQVWPDPNISHANHMKFAELIVRECADIASINQHQYCSVGKYVLEHFGVEE